MSFDPEKVERANPEGLAGMKRQWDGRWVAYTDYAQLLTLLHDVSTEADPAGTLRENIALKETCGALEIRVQELQGSLTEEIKIVCRIWNALGVKTYADAHGKEISQIVAEKVSRVSELEAEVARLKGEA